ncbi:MAG: shikimate kinase [Myxococcota bacterium]
MLVKRRPRLLLWGFMGTGKSTVGRRVAAARGVPFIDLDQTVATEVGEPLAAFFARDGYAAFRAVVARILRTWLAREGPYLVALGGGALLDEALRVEAKERTWVVALDAPPAVLAARLADEHAARPLLAEPADQPLEARIAARLATRRDGYDDAHERLDASGPVDEVADALIKMWRPNA